MLGLLLFSANMNMTALFLARCPTESDGSNVQLMGEDQQQCLAGVRAVLYVIRGAAEENYTALVGAAGDENVRSTAQIRKT